MWKRWILRCQPNAIIKLIASVNLTGFMLSVFRKCQLKCGRVWVLFRQLNI